MKGLGDASLGVYTKLATVTLHSPIKPDFHRNIKVVVKDKLTQIVPSERVNHTMWNHLSGHQLADPEFATTGKGDCIIGSDGYYSLLLGGIGPLAHFRAHVADVASDSNIVTRTLSTKHCKPFGT